MTRPPIQGGTSHHQRPAAKCRGIAGKRGGKAGRDGQEIKGEVVERATARGLQGGECVVEREAERKKSRLQRAKKKMQKKKEGKMERVACSAKVKL